jgi:putative aldouronate transport system substrate-binding protein
VKISAISKLARVSAAIMAIMIAMAGCGGGANQQTTSQSSASDGAGASSASDGAGASSASSTTVPKRPYADDENPLAFEKYDPPVTFTYALETVPDQQFFNNDNYDDNAWTRRIEEDLGIKLEIAWSADERTDAYRNKLNVSMAAGDLPDLFTGDYSIFTQARESGLLADLTDVVSNYASNEVNEIKKANQYFFDPVIIDGRQMAFPSLGDGLENQSPFLWIRDDWLKAVGMAPPKTLDEMRAIAEAFATKDPDGNGVNDTSGLGLGMNIFSESYGGMLGVVSAFGTPALNFSESGTGMWMRDENNQIVWSALQPGTRDALEYVRGMYLDGLIDKEFGVKDLSKLEDDVNQEKVGMMYGSVWNGFWPFPNIIRTNPEAVYIPYAIPTVEGITPRIGVPWPVYEYYFVSSNCEHPEAVMKMLNLARHINGDQGSMEEFEMYENNVQWRLSPVGISDPGVQQREARMTNEAIAKNDPSIFDAWPKSKIKYDLVMDYINNKNTDGMQYAQWSQLGPNSTTWIVIDNYIPNGYIEATALRGALPMAWIEKGPSLEKIQLQAFTEIIMGGDMSLFDKYVTDWLNAGGAEVTAEMNEMYN